MTVLNLKEIKMLGQTVEGIKGPGKNITGLSGLQSIGLLQSIGNPDTEVSTGDIIGLIGGGAIGFLLAKKFPSLVIKYVGVIVGAELGVLIARMIRK